MSLRRGAAAPVRLLLLLLVAGALVAGSAACADRRLALERGDAAAVTPEELRSIDPEALDDARRDGIVAALADLLGRRAAAPDAIPTDVAVEAAITLRRLVPEPDVAVAAALPLLEDPDRTVRYFALRLLALYPADERAAAAGRARRDDPDPLIAGEARLMGAL